MAIRPWFDVWCDVCSNWVTGGATRREARREACKVGWKVAKDECVCPPCLREREVRAASEECPRGGTHAHIGHAGGRCIKCGEGS